MKNLRDDKANMTEELEIIDQTVRHPWFAFKTERLKSFKNWPREKAQKSPEELAECGFFCLGAYAIILALNVTLVRCSGDTHSMKYLLCSSLNLSQLNGMNYLTLVDALCTDVGLGLLFVVFFFFFTFLSSIH